MSTVSYHGTGNGVRNARVWRALLGVEKTVIEELEFEEGDELDGGDEDDPSGGVLVVHVRPARGFRDRCGICRRRCARYDAGEGRRRWRALDLGTVQVFLEAGAPRVSCREHNVVVAAVPWARHSAGHTHDFDATVAWLATQTSKSAVTELMRIAWRTVGSIIARVWVDTQTLHDRFAGLTRIGIDEISYKKGHRYITVVVDHDSKRLVWAAPGRSKATLRGFFDLLGAERSAQIALVSADAADWIAAVVAERCPNAELCADAFHIVKWATEALDEVRRQAWNDARRPDQTSGNHRGRRDATGDGRRFKHARYALWKNPDNLTDRQRDKLDWIAKTDPRLYRAYLLKEGLRYVFTVKGEAGKQALDRWISWARRCRIPAFVDLQKRIVAHRASIDAALENDLSNALIESTNTKLRLITRVSFGFHSATPLIALAMLSLGGHRPTLPGRS